MIILKIIIIFLAIYLLLFLITLCALQLVKLFFIIRNGIQEYKKHQEIELKQRQVNPLKNKSINKRYNKSLGVWEVDE